MNTCIYFPQFSAYVLIAVFSALVIIVVGVYDCCISGKCESCSSHLLSCWRPTEEVQSVGQDNVGRDSVRLGALHDTTQNQRVILCKAWCSPRHNTKSESDPFFWGTKCL